MAWNVLSGAAKMAWDVLSGVTKTAWDVLSGVANRCGMFCPGCQKMAWDVLSWDVLSYIPEIETETEKSQKLKKKTQEVIMLFLLCSRSLILVSKL